MNYVGSEVVHTPGRETSGEEVCSTEARKERDNTDGFKCGLRVTPGPLSNSAEQRKTEEL